MASAGGVVSTFFLVFASVFAMLWYTASLWLTFAVVGIYFGQLFYRRAEHAGAVQQNQTAVNLLNAGQIDDAARIFDALTKSERKTAAHPVYVFNRAVAYTLQGRPRRAYSLFNAIDRSGAFTVGFASSFLPLLYIELGTCLALLGRLEAARHYRKLVAERLRVEEVGRVVFLDALILIRSSDAAGANDYIRRHWRAAEGMLRVPTMKALRLLQAYALAQLGHERTSEFHALVEGVKPCRAGEFDWVGAEWPEFAAFLQRLHLR